MDNANTKSASDSDNHSACSSPLTVDTKYICPIGDMTHSSQHEFKLHIRSHILSAKVFTCRIGSKVFNFYSSLDLPILVHSEEHPFMNANMERQMETHLQKPGRNYESNENTDISAGIQYTDKMRKRKLKSTNNDKQFDTNSNKRKSNYFANKENDNNYSNKQKPRNLNKNNINEINEQKYHYPISDKEDFASLNILENNHPKSEAFMLAFPCMSTLEIYQEARINTKNDHESEPMDLSRLTSNKYILQNKSMTSSVNENKVELPEIKPQTDFKDLKDEQPVLTNTSNKNNIQNLRSRARTELIPYKSLNKKESQDIFTAEFRKIKKESTRNKMIHNSFLNKSNKKDIVDNSNSFTPEFKNIVIHNMPSTLVNKSNNMNQAILKNSSSLLQISSFKDHKITKKEKSNFLFSKKSTFNFNSDKKIEVKSLNKLKQILDYDTHYDDKSNNTPTSSEDYSKTNHSIDLNMDGASPIAAQMETPSQFYQNPALSKSPLHINIEINKNVAKLFSVKPQQKTPSLHIKDDVLMPKQNVMPYSTKQPFSCEHCFTRFTLLNNFRHHIKVKHPQFWSRKPRSKKKKASQKLVNAFPSTIPSKKYEDNEKIYKKNTKHSLSEIETKSNMLDNMFELRQTHEKEMKNYGNALLISKNEEIEQDLVPVETLLDNAFSLPFLFWENNGMERITEENKKGLVSNGSMSDRNDYDCDENKLENETIPTTSTGKKQSAYIRAPSRVSCPYCLREFPCISSLSRHILIHTGQTPFKCPQCHLYFNTRSSCKRHFFRKHSNNTTSKHTNSNIRN